MGLSSSKSTQKSSNTSTVAPSAAYAPYTNQAIGNAQSVFNANQGAQQGLASSVLAGYNSIAPAAYSPSAYVTNAQHTAQGIANGQYVGTNPGAATYASLQGAANPAISSLSGLTQTAANNPYASQLGNLATGYNNPAMAGLTSLAQGSTSPGNYDGIGGYNPALGAYASLLDGGRNSAIGGLTGAAYGTGSLGAGDKTLGSFANTGSNGVANGAAGYDQSVIDGKYLNAEPGSALYSKLINGDPAVNPYVDAITKQATNAATLANNQRFGMSGLGADNSSAYSAALGSAVADANNQTRYTAYNDAANRQLTAAGQADAAFANERNNMEGASGRISTNYNAAQDRSQAAANSLSAGSRADAAYRLGALNDLSGANNQRTQNALTAASGLGSTYANAQQLGLQAQQAKDSAFQNDRAAQLAATQGLGSLYDQGVTARGSMLQNAGALYGQGQGQAITAAQGMGSLYSGDNATRLDAAKSADTAQQNAIQQQLAALNMTGSLTDAQYAGINPALQLAGAASTIPYQGLNSYANLINGLTGQYTTQTGSGTITKTSTPSGIAQIGTGLKLAGQIGSLFG